MFKQIGQLVLNLSDVAGVQQASPVSYSREEYVAIFESILFLNLFKVQQKLEDAFHLLIIEFIRELNLKQSQVYQVTHYYKKTLVVNLINFITILFLSLIINLHIHKLKYLDNLLLVLDVVQQGKQAALEVV